MTQIGLDISRPINPYSGDISPDTQVGLIGQITQVRLMFMLGPWESPQNMAWQRRYDEIVDRYLAQGVQIYGFIGQEIVKNQVAQTVLQGDHTSARVAEAEAWIEQYVDHCRQIIRHFQGRIQVFESINEPNKLLSNREPALSPYWFAKILASLWQAVKIEAGLRDVQLIAGPLYAHNLGAQINSEHIGWQYLAETFQQGKQFHQWETLHTETGRYPLDGLGYHPFLNQFPSQPAAHLAASLRQYLDALYHVWTRADSEVSQKQIYVSALGWQSAVVGEQTQAENMKVAFGVLDNDPRVSLGVWYSLNDFPDRRQSGGQSRYGLFQAGTPQLVYAKPAYHQLQAIAKAAAELNSQVGPIADGFQYPLRRPGRQWHEDFYIAASFLDPSYPNNSQGANHPGEDWNDRRGGDSDLGEPVFAVSHGRVVASGSYGSSWGNVILIEHTLPNQHSVWSQYAHLLERQVRTGQVVARGQQIGRVGKAAWPYAHLHFEIRTQDLPPYQWLPQVASETFVRNHYAEPSSFIHQHLAENESGA